MLKEIEVFVALVVLLIAVLFILNARMVVRLKMNKDNENIKVTIVKIIGVVLAILSLIANYYLLNR